MTTERATARARKAAADAVELPSGVTGLSIEATQCHGLKITMTTVTPANCTAAAQALLAHVAASPMRPGAAILTDLADRYRVLSEHMARHIGTGPPVPRDTD